jgi:hypothetical protein
MCVGLVECVRQTFQEWAHDSLARCQWARAYYDQHRARGKQHHAIIRGLAFKWIRILYRCSQNRTPYQEAAYSTGLARRSPAPATNVEIVWKKTVGYFNIAAFNN